MVLPDRTYPHWESCSGIGIVNPNSCITLLFRLTLVQVATHANAQVLMNARLWWQHCTFTDVHLNEDSFIF